MTLKQQLFNRDTVLTLARRIHVADPSFPVEEFTLRALKRFPPLELKQRMTALSELLEDYLPDDFEEAVAIFRSALHHNAGEHFVYGAIQEYVMRHGNTDEHVDLALAAIGEFTSAFSGEFAIRPFLNDYPAKTMAIAMTWAESADLHQRRLASEGLRPSLPWAPAITLDYKIAATPLDHLYHDPVRYVTRSVANHLNDISKFDPDFVLNTLKRWQNEDKQDTAEFDYIVRHSLRTLIKQGHPGALAMRGFDLDPDITDHGLHLSADTIAIGDALEMTLTIAANESCRLVIDYIITYQTKSGRLSDKTYKWTTLDLAAKDTKTITAKRPFVHRSTRTLYPGPHVVTVQINGVRSHQATVMLVEGQRE